MNIESLIKSVENILGIEILVLGGLYSATHEKDGYIIIKLLEFDNQGVHIRVYSNWYQSRPIDVDVSTLYIAGINRKPEELLGIGHIPLSRKSFRGWRVRYIKKVPVVEEELDGYRMWKEAKGGYF